MGEKTRDAMAGLFLLLLLAQVCIYFKKESAAITLTTLSLFFALGIFLYHTTDTLNINL